MGHVLFSKITCMCDLNMYNMYSIFNVDITVNVN